jgi:YhcH/YjgK/YiaL family protein
MKNILFKVMVLASILGFLGFRSSTDPSTWSKKQIDKWFEKGEWLNGWKVTPDKSINRKEFAISYYKNKDRWDKAFTFLKSTDLKNIEVKRHDIDGNNVYALVSQYLTKNEEDAKYEAHRNYADIQYVITGTEQMGIAPMSELGEVTTAYNAANDIEFMTVKKGTQYTATPEKVFFFFPSDIHRPSVKIGENAQVKKVVIKVKLN